MMGILPLVLLLAPSIAALVIGREYDDSSVCNENYIIHLKSFLLVAGWVYIGWFLLWFLILIGSAKCCSLNQQSEFIFIAISLFSCPLLMWSFIWSVFGLYIYNTEMSTVCQNEPIGLMILSWSVIQIILIGIGLCIIACPLCYMR